MEIAAIIVCRKGSVRISKKYLKKINNISLVEKKIIELKKVKNLKHIYLGSNDENLKKICNFHKIIFVRRPDKFCNEKISTANDMIKNMLSYVNEEIIVWAHLTNPFINYKHYNEAIKIFLKNKKKYDSLFSVNILKNHFWDHCQKPINHNPFSKKHIPAKQLKPIFSQNGGIFIREKIQMIKDGRFIGNKPYMYLMDEISGWDLDYPWQLELARTLFNKKYAK